MKLASRDYLDYPAKNKYFKETHTEQDYTGCITYLYPWVWKTHGIPFLWFLEHETMLRHLGSC